MSLPFPETFVRQRQARGQGVAVGRNVHQGHSALGILSNSERLSLEDLEWILMTQDDLSVENVDGAVRQQILGPMLMLSGERPQHDLLALPDTNGMDEIEF